MSSTLDLALINRAAPPGSMRFFALLYTPAEKRDEVTALFVIEAELRESALSANHDVAHTRLQWWRQEIDRLVNNNAQHPATRVLANASREHRHFSKLHELIVAADMDLARMTYSNQQEMRAYCSRSGGSIAELIAIQLAAPAALEGAPRAAANMLGALVRAAEIIRDVRQDAYEGRLYLPLDVLEQHNVKHEELRAKELSPNARAALAQTAAKVSDDIEQACSSIPASSRAYLRPLYVLAGLHAGLLQQIARINYDVGSARVDLGPVRKPWLAWRAARRAG
jgi:15-cis-phytoene synthase